MKRNIIIVPVASLLIVAAGCSKKFLEEKGDLTGVNEQVFKDPLMAQAYVDYVYFLFQPADNAVTPVVYQTGANGSYSDVYTKTTDEMAGQTDYNRVWSSISITQNHANQYFAQRMTPSISNNVWTRMRQINIFLAEIDKHGLPEDVRRRLKGQMYFWRGFQYFELLKLYGGVPIILEPQNPIVEDGDHSLEVPRSSSAQTLAQIEADLDKAIEMLPGRWTNVSDWGKITSGAAAALKGRVLLTWASPLFNRTDDRTRWQKAYDANLAARTLLENNSFGLHTSWENMWFQATNNPEAVLVYCYNNVSSDLVQRNNGWEQATRSKQIQGNGSISPTKQIVDAFPMADGKMPSEASAAYPYVDTFFYKNRDPRFYKTFVYNGALWPYAANPNHRQWTYSWWSHSGDTTKVPNRFTETQGANASGIYVSKMTNPNASTNGGNFQYSPTDYMEIRFAEVVLNLAESAIGIDRLSEGLQLIEEIRERAGVLIGDDGHYGLAGVMGDRDKLFGAVINERKVEFAYENKRFWDLRRWMLFNDDFGTCTRLGQTPINGTRRTAYYIYVITGTGAKFKNIDSDDKEDPLLRRADGTVRVVDRDPPGLTPEQFAAHLDFLYKNHFRIIERDNLDPNPPWTFTWYNEYYFFGLHQNILIGSPYLQQTKGWPDMNGGQGTFDPLAN